LCCFTSKQIHAQYEILGLFFIGLISTSSLFSQIALQSHNTDSKLFLGKGKNQPLIVGLGGSEGGNAWATDHWKTTRDKFIQQGYAFLALGYFAAPGAPDTLDQIALEDVHNSIMESSKHKLIDASRIAIIGGSRGGDLALLLASHYPDIKCVVALVPSHVTFPGHTMHFTTSCWTYEGKQLPFVPLNDEAIPFLLQRDLRNTFEAMLRDADAERKSAIEVEKIKAPILLLSATKDEIIPSTSMCNKMMARLKANSFPYPYQHIVIEGSHAEPLNHFDQVFLFLQKNFKS